jgi:hypothetical protein
MIKLVDIVYRKSYASDDKDDTYYDKWIDMERVSRMFLGRMSDI